MNIKMKITILIGIVLSGTIFAILYGTQNEVLPIGSLLPHLKYISMSDSGYITIRNRPLMIIYFKPDCPHCEYELDLINKRFIEFSGFDLHFITTDNKFIRDSVYSKWNNLKRSRYVIFASINENEYRDKFGIMVTPVFYFFNSSGYLTEKIIGEIKFDRLIESIKNADDSKYQIN
jgi:thioredoxin-related protein